MLSLLYILQSVMSGWIQGTSLSRVCKNLGHFLILQCLLTSEPNRCHFPESSCQYQSHSVVWMKSGLTREFRVDNLLTLFPSLVIVSKCTGGQVPLLDTKSEKDLTKVIDQSLTENSNIQLNVDR